MDNLMWIGSGVGDKSGPQLSGAGIGLDPEELKRQAGTLWRMLDDLAENDPKAYDAFLRNQADAARQATTQLQSASGHDPLPEQPAVVLVSTMQMEERALLLGCATAASVAIYVWPAPGTLLQDMAQKLPAIAPQGNVPVASIIPPRTWQSPPQFKSTFMGKHLHCAVPEQIVKCAAGTVPPSSWRAMLYEALRQWAADVHGMQLAQAPRILLFNRALVESVPSAGSVSGGALNGVGNLLQTMDKHADQGRRGQQHPADGPDMSGQPAMARHRPLIEEVIPSR